MLRKMKQMAYKAINYPHRKKITGYYSQYGQDKLIAEILNYKREGFFIDIGANDGISLSNSYYFEKELGWYGIAIEPSSFSYKKLKENRNCVTIEACILNYDGETPFMKLEGKTQMLSGVPTFYSREHIKRINSTIKKHGGKKEDVTVKCYTINTLLETYNIKLVDYLSIDTEGGEYEILNAIDFNKYHIQTISIENNYQNTKIRKLLKKHNFRFIGITGCDEIYQNNAILTEEFIVSQNYSSVIKKQTVSSH